MDVPAGHARVLRGEGPARDARAAGRHDQSQAKLLPKEGKGKIKKLMSGSHRNGNAVRREKA